MPTDTSSHSTGEAQTALPDHLSPTVQKALTEVKARFEATYGERLRRIVLYGSRARGDAGPDSDVDLLVVLQGPIENYYREIKRMGDLRSDLMDRYRLYFSFHPYTESAFQDLRRPFIQNVREEGVSL